MTTVGGIRGRVRASWSDGLDLRRASCAGTVRLPGRAAYDGHGARNPAPDSVITTFDALRRRRYCCEGVAGRRGERAGASMPASSKAWRWAAACGAKSAFMFSRAQSSEPSIGSIWPWKRGMT